jgi:hypothetical protein
MIKTAKTFSHRTMHCLILLLALSLLYGCGAVNKANSPAAQSPANPSTQPSPIAVSPGRAQIRAGDSQQFSLTLSGVPVPPDCVGNAKQNRRYEPQDRGTHPARPCTVNVGRTNSGVTWSVNSVPGGNAAVGTIDAKGLYRAPATVPSSNPVKVTATSVAAPSISATTLLTLYNPIPVVTSASPNKVSVGAFSLTVIGGGFAKGAQVLFAGEALQTAFSSATQLIATGNATQSHVGNIQVFVRNPDPGSASSTVALSVQVIQPSDASQVPSQDPAGIFDGQGNFDAAAYVKMAKAYGTPAMITERFGSPWTAYHQTIAAPTWTQAASIKYVKPTNPAEWFYYSRGVPCTTPDDYSSNYAQVAYVTDLTVGASQPGVDGIQTLNKDHCVWAGQPQLRWTMGSGHDGRPTVTLRPDIVREQDPYGMPLQPVEVTRAYGASEAAGCSYMVFQTGQVACGEGGNTAQDFYYFNPFPTNFVPTAASVTNNGEFLLVTGWNTDTYQGQLAVIAIGSSKPVNTFWWYEWTETYPGFRNYSLPAFNKLLGIVDLPMMAAPTAVEAVGNWVYHGAWLPGSLNPGQFPLSNQANWQCFVNGQCASLYDTKGFALVASRYERKVLLLDLTALFQVISQGMFGSWTQFRANVANTGVGPGQWPPTFAELPSETLTVVKTMEFDNQVTAISASLYPDNLAFIATEDGNLHVWDVDGLQTGTGTGTSAREIYNLKIGRNVTRIAHVKHWLLKDIVNGIVRYQYIVLSRGDKTVTWIDMSSGVPTVLRVLSDSRLVDPISVEDNNNHLTQSDLIDIADYGDKNVKAYRYGPVIFYGVANPSPVFGMGPGGLDPFEYEGAYATPTGPFSISGENVP